MDKRSANTDKIILKDLHFFGYHGVLDKEKKEGQEFIVDLILYADLRTAGISDDLGDTVNYAAVYDAVKNIVELQRFDLLEALAAVICQEIDDNFPQVSGVHLAVKKPQAPLPGRFAYAAVEIERYFDRV